MQCESLAAVEHTATLSASILQARWRLAADCRNQIVRIADDSHGLRLLLNVLNLDLLLLLLLLLMGLSLGLSLSLSLSRLLLGLGLRLLLSLSLRLLLLNHRCCFVSDDCSVWCVGVQTAVNKSIVGIQLSL